MSLRAVDRPVHIVPGRRATGNRTAITELSGRTVNYTYDDLYRLTNEAIANDPHGVNGTVSYGYDLVGNRLNRTSSLAPLPSQNSTYDANDRLTSDNYDNNGNTTSANSNTYAYDFENHLTSLNNGSAGYVYDGDGNRVAKTVAGVTTNYLVDTNNPTGYAQVVDELQSGSVVKSYTYGHDLISQRIVGGSLSFYGYDGHGSVRLLTDASATITDTYDYDAFGNLTYRSGTTPNDYLYSGEQLDANLGFYYLRARYMNPSTGRFLGMDPLAGSIYDPSSLHKYLYVHDDPVNCWDPSGMFSIGELAMNMAIGGILNTIPTILAGGTLREIGTSFVIGALEGAAFYGAAATTLKLLLRFARGVQAARAVAALTAVFSKIEAAGPLWEGTAIPRFFTFVTRVGKVFLNPNATKHMADLLTGGAASETRIAAALTLESLEDAIVYASVRGINYGEKMVVGNWELIFVLERSAQEELVPLVLKHAIYIP